MLLQPGPRWFPRVPQRARFVLLFLIPALAALAALTATQAPAADDDGDGPDGRQIFRHDTFGDERFWTDELGLHMAIQLGLDPLTALSLGLRVDADALPDGLIESLTPDDLDDPQTTVALIQLDAVVGIKGKVTEHEDGGLELTQVGITCALCHSTVDNSVMPGIGRRLDGWPNRDLDPGAIIAASPVITDAQKKVYLSWGPGRYDPRFNFDGINGPVLIPPAYGLDGVKLATYTGDGDISYWNDYVAVTQMGGQGVFIDRRIGVKVVRTPDLVQPKLRPLRDYQFDLDKPAPPKGSFDPQLAAAGKAVFDGAGRCAKCHTGPQYTDVNRGILHDPAETGMDPTYARRSATKKYRTTPLRALWQHAPYFHDGSAETLEDVVDHYNGVLRLSLTDAQKEALVEFLKSI